MIAPPGIEVAGEKLARVAMLTEAPSRHVWVGELGTAFLPHPYVRGVWIQSNACVVYVACPHCGVPAGTLCISTSGKHTGSCHYKRRNAYSAAKAAAR